MTERPDWTVTVETDPDLAIRDRILAPLAAFNAAHAGPADYAPLAVTVRDAAGEVAGGLWGRMGRGFLAIEYLALGPARGHGLGRQVMAAAEAEARQRGLRGMWLHTWTFQAPGFYEKLGFSECGRIPDYPPGHDCIFFVKRFAPSR